MFVQQFFVKGLAHSSYLLGGTSTCAIVDPRRDIQVYLDAAKEMGMKITHILETHLHADFISGHLDLARRTGAKIYAPKAGRCEFEHVALDEGDSFEIEDMNISVLDTAGHTPEHISYVVVDRARGSEPSAVFCGDTLFVGDVGRPDLFPGKARDLAGKLFDNLHGKLMQLPDFCQVFPAHGAGSLCGRAMGAMRTTTIGYERKCNAALQITAKEEFITSLTTNMPPPPDHFSRCSATNAKGPALVDDLPTPVPMSPGLFADVAQETDAIVLDTRPLDAFGGQHVPGAYHIDFGGNFVTFAGWMLPVDKKVLLVCETPEQAAEANIWLHRVGLDQIVGQLEGGMYAWAKAGFETAQVPQVSVHELHRRISAGDRMTILDVRTDREFGAFHIDGALNIPTPELRLQHDRLPRDLPVMVICNTGHRSSLAASLLKQCRLDNINNVPGGMTAYSAAGFAPECPTCVLPHGPMWHGKKRSGQSQS